MKSFALIALCLLSSIIYSQGKVSTTLEEYNYLTQGYALQLQNGGDMKAGYELVKYDEDSSVKFTMSYFLLKKMDSKKTQAVLIVLKKGEDKIRYLCLPINNKDLFKKYGEDVMNLGLSMSTMFEASLSRTLAKLLDEKLNAN